MYQIGEVEIAFELKVVLIKKDDFNILVLADPDPDFRKTIDLEAAFATRSAVTLEYLRILNLEPDKWEKL